MPRGVSVSATTWGTRWSFTDGNLCCRLLSRRSGRRRITIFNSAAESFFASEGERNIRPPCDLLSPNAAQVNAEKVQRALQNPLPSSRIQVVPLPRVNPGLAGRVCFSENALESICLLNGNNRVEFAMLNEHRWQLPQASSRQVWCAPGELADCGDASVTRR